MMNDKLRMTNGECRESCDIGSLAGSIKAWDGRTRTSTDEHGRNGEGVWYFAGPLSFIILHLSFIVRHPSFIIPHSSCLHLPFGNWYTEESLGAGDAWVDGPRPILRDFFGAGDAGLDGLRPILRDFFGSRAKGARQFLRPKERKCQLFRVSIALSGNSFCGS